MNDTARRTPAFDSPQAAEDNRLAEEVSQRLLASGLFMPRQVQVTSSEGVIRLQGEVGSYYQKQWAQTTALRANGARHVVNEIDVAPYSGDAT